MVDVHHNAAKRADAVAKGEGKNPLRQPYKMSNRRVVSAKADKYIFSMKNRYGFCIDLAICAQDLSVERVSVWDRLENAVLFRMFNISSGLHSCAQRTKRSLREHQMHLLGKISLF